VDLLVLGDAPPDAAFDALGDFAMAGGWIVAALRSAEQAAALPSLLGVQPFEIREAELSSYAMLSNINFDHPLFARLADARYNDFTKIRFWKMRELLLPDSLDDVHVLATFDNDRPALIERLMGDGGLLVLASTWSPDDSQLALSTKFIPLVAGWLNAASPLPEQPPRRFAGQSFELAAPFTAAEPITVDVHHESPTRSTLAEINERPIAKPGHYRLQQGEIEQTIAVNVAPAESRTAPIDPAMLEQFGVRVGRAIRPQDEAERQRQLRDRELEKRQQVWRWLIAAALVLLVTETWIAGYLARRVAMQTPVHGLAS
jgi:hypothetical protein